MYLQNEGVLRHETLQLFLFLFPLRHMKRPALHNKQAGVLRMAFRARKDFGTFEKRAPGLKTSAFTRKANPKKQLCVRNIYLHNRSIHFFTIDTREIKAPFNFYL